MVSEEENVSEAVLRSYLKKIEKAFQIGNATEHTYRPDLKELLQNLYPGVTVTNEPKHIKCGAPDFIITNKQTPLGYIETKDIGVSLERTERTEQLKNYPGSLTNLILTDYKAGITFTREHAAYDIPKTNPFLRKMFNYMAGPDLDERIVWLVVSYIVRSVDYLLKKEFELPDGLADYSKIKMVSSDGTLSIDTNKLPHKVQILDPATGTFLYYVIKQINESFKNNTGIWSSYVSEHLLPRLFGFELLMAPYAVAHLKLGLQLRETGYDFRSNERLVLLC